MVIDIVILEIIDFSLSRHLDVVTSQHLLDKYNLIQILYIYLLPKFGEYRSYRNGNSIEVLISIRTWIPWKSLNSPPWSCRIPKYLKSGIPIYNSEIPDTAGRKTRRRRKRRTQAISKCYVFHADAKTLTFFCCNLFHVNPYCYWTIMDLFLN